VHFGARTPFRRFLLQSVEGVIQAPVREIAAPGAYPYVVAVVTPEMRVFMDTCPEILIEVPSWSTTPGQTQISQPTAKSESVPVLPLGFSPANR
jgi:hypothetical protein